MPPITRRSPARRQYVAQFLQGTTHGRFVRRFEHAGVIRRATLGTGMWVIRSSSLPAPAGQGSITFAGKKLLRMTLNA